MPSTTSRSIRLRLFLASSLLAIAWVSACGSNGGSKLAAASGAGGEANGGEANGGERSEGGTPSAGGAPSDGGEPSEGGSPADGGEVNGGGASGGEPSTAGVPGSGGSAGSGGEAPSEGGAPSEGETVTLTTSVDGVQSNVLLVAFQDGDAPWEMLAGAGGVYRFAVEDRYGVAVICRRDNEPDPGTRTDVWALYARVSELPELRRGCETMTAPLEHELSVSANGLPLSTSALVAVGNTSFVVTPETSEVTELMRAGEYPVLARRRLSDDSGGIDLFVLLRDFAVFEDRSLLIDFESQGLETVEGSAVVTGAAEDDVEVYQTLVTENGTELALDGYADYRALPATELEGDEVQLITASLHDAGEGTLRSQVRGERDMNGTFELQIPPLFEQPLVYPVATESPVRLAVEGEMPSGMQAVQVTVTQSVEDDSRVWSTLVTSGWLGESGLVFELPDLAEIDDWDDDFGLVQGEVLAWELDVRTTNRGLGYALFGTTDPTTRRVWPDLDGSVKNVVSLGSQLVP